MPKQPRTEYVVEGPYPFPMDMLRREFSYPATTNDANALGAAADVRSPDGVHRVRLITTALWPWQLNAARWESMGWKIVEGAG